MKVFCYVGSNSKNSVGAQASALIEERLRCQGMTTFFHTGRNTNIKWCEGCNMCFKTGECPIATKDDMEKIRDEMKEADIIIWVSPVYAVNVSGMMKNYLDRITSWIHTCELAGKLGVVLTVSSNNSSEFTNFYLKRLLLMMGCNVIGDHQLAFLSGKTIDSLAQDVIADISLAIKENKQFASTKELENNYQHLKKVFGMTPEDPESINAYEVRYWHWISKQGYDTFDDYINLKNKKRGGA